MPVSRRADQPGRPGRPRGNARRPQRPASPRRHPRGRRGLWHVATSSAAPTRSATCAVPPDQPYELTLAPPTVRAITADLPEAVDAAVVEFTNGVLVHNPHRVGKPLRADLTGTCSARRGTDRVLDRINENS